MTRLSLRRFGRNRDGIAAVEFALILPFLCAVAFGSLEAALMVRASLRVNVAAQAVADLVSQQLTLSAASMTNICNGGQLTMLPMAQTGFAAAVASVTNSGASRKQDWQDTTCGGAAAMADAVSLAATATSTSGSSAVVVRVTYAYTSPTSFVFAARASLSGVAIAKPRSGTTISHS